MITSIMLCVTPHSLYGIKFTMELWQEHHPMTLIQDHFLYLGLLKLEISHFLNLFYHIFLFQSIGIHTLSSSKVFSPFWIPLESTSFCDLPSQTVSLKKVAYHHLTHSFNEQ